MTPDETFQMCLTEAQDALDAAKAAGDYPTRTDALVAAHEAIDRAIRAAEQADEDPS